MDSEIKNEVEREAEKSEASQQAQPEAQKEEHKISVPKINLPKIQIQSESIQKILNKLKEYKRVLLITKKPDMEEFKTTVKASALGMTIIGVVGFIIAIIAQVLTT